MRLSSSSVSVFSTYPFFIYKRYIRIESKLTRRVQQTPQGVSAESELTRGQVEQGLEVLLLQDGHVLLVFLAQGFDLVAPLAAAVARGHLDLLAADQLLDPLDLPLDEFLLALPALAALGEAQVLLEERVFLQQLRDLPAVDIQRLVEGFVKPSKLDLPGLRGEPEGGEGLREVDLCGADGADDEGVAAGGERGSKEAGEFGVAKGNMAAELGSDTFSCCSPACGSRSTG